MQTGAWFIQYKKGIEGTLGESLLLESDNLGWAIRSWKYELTFNGFRGGMKLDMPVFGDAMDNQVRSFQKSVGLKADGVISRDTGKALLQKRIEQTATAYGLQIPHVRGMVAHESDYDIGAIGQDDHNDRGCTQKHIYETANVNLSQAIRPALAIPRLASQLRRLSIQWDSAAAIASWNVGEGGAEWWWENGKPATGHPSWWPYGDLAARATGYVAAVLQMG